ncbi:MAG: serine hydrolase [Bacteroidota bacterium]
MTNKIKLLLGIIILAYAGNAQQNMGPAPEATKAEAELRFWDVPNLEPAYVSVTPENRKDGIPVGALGVDGGKKEIILEMAKKITDSIFPNYDSFLISHKGKLVFESYYKHGRINLPHPQASATKAFTCLALGRAIQMGYLSMDDLDKPLVHFLKDLDPTKFVEGAEKITLAKALTMRSGVRFTEDQKKEMENNPDQLKGQQQIQTLLSLSAPITEASQSFKYQGDPTFVMQVLDAVVPGSAKDFIKTELLDKLGITNYVWSTAPNGLPEAGWKVSMTSRDMVKWGTLVMNEGQWNNEQLISKAYLKQGVNRILLTGDDDVFGGGENVSKQGYGYYWWSADLKHNNKKYLSTSAQGGGGQYIVLIEELDLMVVVTAHDNDNRTLQIISEYVLPAFAM